MKIDNPSDLRVLIESARTGSLTAASAALAITPAAASAMLKRMVAQLVLCAAPHYLRQHPAPERPQDLLKHNCLIFERAGRRNSVRRFAQHGQWTEVRVKGDRNVGDASLARDWALAGAGLTLKSNIDVHADLASGALVALLPDWQTEPCPLHAQWPLCAAAGTGVGEFFSDQVRRMIK